MGTINKQLNRCVGDGCCRENSYFLSVVKSVRAHQALCKRRKACHTSVSYGYARPNGFHRSLQLCVFWGFFVGFFLPQLYLINVIIIKTNAFTFIYFMVSSQEQQKHLIFWHDVSTII